MIFKALLFSVGCFYVSFLPILPPLWLVIVVAISVSILGLWWRRYALIFLALGLLWGVVFGQQLLDSLLPAELEGREFWVEGLIVDLPRKTERNTRFRLQVSAIKPVIATKVRPNLTLLQLSCYQHCPTFLAGEYWRLRVKLKRPRGFFNAGGFDYRLWLLQQGVSATGYVRGSESDMVLLPSSHWSVDSWREKIRTAILSSVVDAKSQALLLALSIGDGSKLTFADWRLLRHTGTSHLLVISGLHVGFVALLFYGLGCVLGRAVNLVWCRVSGFLVAASVSVLGALLYAALAGFGLPSVRALTMLTVVLLFKCLRIHVGHFSALAVALAVIAFIEPLALHSASFWLSFSAVFVLLWALGRRTAGLRWWQKLWWPQWLIFIGLGCLLLCFFGQIPLLSPLVNIVAIPVVSVLIVPLCLLAIIVVGWLPWCAEYLWRISSFLLIQLWDWLLWLAPFCESSLIALPIPLSPSLFVFLLLSTLLWLLPKGVTGRWLAILPWLFIGLYEQQKPPLTVTVLDVGQGLAVVVETRQHTLVYDAGAAFGSKFSAGSGIVAPFLRSQAIANVDRLIVSHGDGDHAGGVTGLLAEFAVADILSGEEIAEVGDQLACQAGQRWRWDDVDFEILSPPVPATFARPNNRSCVLLVSYAGQKVLLPGDIEQEVEARLSTLAPLQAGIDLLIAPHHGSQTSSTGAFVSILRPRHVVYSAGFKHHFGHPHAVVQRRYQWQQSKQWNTASAGAVSFVWQNGSWLTSAERNKIVRYWHIIDE